MSIFGTGFGQSNQQQQQQPQQNAFGQPNAFGGSGFGAFGQNQQQQQQQPQQPQQPQTNPMFGNLATSSSNPSGGFGAFGGTSNTTSTFGQPKTTFGSTAGGTGAFGGSQPTAFGSTSGSGAFGNAGTSGGAFGASGSGGGAFGQPQQPNAFGGGGGLFGKPAGTSSFGGNALAPSLPTAGSSNPPYQEFQERDTSTGSLSTMLHYQSISCMPAYRNASFEELRVQDYQQGRKTANSFGTAAPSAFGQPAQQPPSGGGLFGQPSTSNAFGQQTQQQQPAGGAFGAFGQQQQQPQQQSAFGTFGQTPQQQQQATAGGFNAFGQMNQNPQQPAGGAFGAFGQQQQPQQPAGFGTFGQQNQQNKSFGAFGQTQPSTTGFSAFGNNAGSNTGSSLFGQQQQPQQNPSPFSAFGQPNTQQNQQNPLLKPSVFGQTSAGGGGGIFGNTGQPQPGGGLFGQQAGQQQPQQQGSGIFGQPSGGSGAFGQPAQAPQQNSLFGPPSSTGGGGLFGNANQQQNQQQPQQNQQPGGGSFGTLFSKPAGGGLFGVTPTQNQNQTQQPQNPNPSNPLFGGGGGLFGNSQQQGQQTNQNPLFGGSGGGSLFGGKPPAPSSSFGGGGLFGNANQQQQQPALGTGIFGNTAGAQQSQPQQSIFGSSQQQQPSLTASIDQPLPSSATSLPPLPSLAASLNSPKKKSNVFADVAARSSPRLGLGLGGGALNYAPPGPGSKLRGFGSSTSTMTIAKNPFALPPPGGSPGKNGGSLLSPDAFGGGTNGMLGGARQSVKKLVLDKRVDEEELHRLRGGTVSPGVKAREVRFSPALGVASREREHESASSPPSARSTAPSAAPQRPSSRLNDVSNVSTLHSTKDSNSRLDPQEGEYWCLPTVAELQQLSFSALQAVKDFTVGRVGFGTIQFLQPVDLTAVPSIADIPGKIVTFEHVECMLYPDERLKPPKGEGLNVPARIKLDQCWALDKSTREPIKDEKDPKHLQRLRKMKTHEGAEFVSFDMETGVWEFTVQEF